MQGYQGSCLLAVLIQYRLSTPPAGPGYPHKNTLFPIHLSAVLATSQH